MARVDVAIPCYNYGRYLRECVGSILTQDLRDLRVLIIDNASTDDSVAVARQLAAEDPRVGLRVHDHNLGPTASYNEAVEWASSEYFMLLDADDLMAPGCLTRAVSIMESHPDIAITYGFEELRGADGVVQSRPPANATDRWEIISGDEFIEQYCRCSRYLINAPTAVRRTSSQKRAGFYRPELRHTDDVEMWLRLACTGSVAKTGLTQGIRRVHEQQASRYYHAAIDRDFTQRELAIESFFANEGRALADGRRLHELARRSLGKHAYWSALSNLVRRRPEVAYTLIAQAVRLCPSVVVLPPVGYLLRLPNPLGRIREVVHEGFSWR